MNVSNAVISVRGLRVDYGEVRAVRGIDLEVRRGEVLAMLGPNGAGKTSTLEVLEGFRHRTAGSVSVLGADPAGAGSGWRARVGVVLQSSEPERHLSVTQCLRLYAGYYPAPRPVEELLALVGLTEQAEVRGSRLSGGQQRRLDVALALVGNPELIFLDEPTSGFDPAARRAAWEVVAGLRSLGKTIVLTTHQLDEAEYLADRIAVLVAGRVVAQGPAETLAGRDRMPATIAFTLPPDDVPHQLPEALAGRVEHEGRRIRIPTTQALDDLDRLRGWSRERTLALEDLTVTRPTLEDVYFRLVRGDHP
jgi:ABC-2 type transport system ATP-binding protein